MPPSRVAERVERLLAIVPYVVRHPGTPLSDLARLFDADEQLLAKDLGVLFLTGVPPYGPGELIDVEIEEGKVWIGMAEPLTRPVRLTPDEALALYLRGTAVLGAPGLTESRALAAALEKLRGGLGEELAELAVEAGEPGKPSGPLDAVRRAVERRERIEVDHYVLARDEVVTRRIDPEHVFAQLGGWYVVAWDHHSEAERMFRVDRIRAVRPTAETFEPRGLEGLGRDLYSPGEGDVRARLALGPGARWVSEYFHVEDERETDGALDVTLPTGDLRWLAKLLLRLGGEAKVVEPDELRELALELAAEAVARYGTP